MLGRCSQGSLMMYHGKQLPLLAQLGHTWRASAVHGERRGGRRRKRGTGPIEQTEECCEGLQGRIQTATKKGKKDKRVQRKQEQKTDYKWQIPSSRNQTALAAVSWGWENATVIAPTPIQSPVRTLRSCVFVCARDCVCVCGLPKFSRRRQEILPLPSRVLPSSSALCSLPGADWLEGKARDGVLSSNLPADRHWWASVEWL